MLSTTDNVVLNVTADALGLKLITLAPALLSPFNLLKSSGLNSGLDGILVTALKYSPLKRTIVP